jgi:SAM-dependent methyltransferase
MSCCSQPCAPKPTDGSAVHDSVSKFYANELERKKNSVPTVCDIDAEAYTAGHKLVQDAMESIHPDLKTGSLGCGTPFPPALEGCHVLDLGSGMGRDAFVLSQLVGSTGHVIGIDMTDDMLKAATGYKSWHAEKFGYNNVDFKKGLLETLGQHEELTKDGFDVIVSNCVINLTTDKQKVFKSSFDLLRPGGELFFSDVYVDKPVPESVKKNELAYNACYAGALHWTEFEQMVSSIGFFGPFVTRDVKFPALNKELEEAMGNIKFYSRTVRLIKPLGSRQSKAQAQLKYQGKIPGYEDSFELAKGTVFKVNEPQQPSLEIANAIEQSRYRKYFT